MMCTVIVIEVKIIDFYIIPWGDQLVLSFFFLFFLYKTRLIFVQTQIAIMLGSWIPKAKQRLNQKTKAKKKNGGKQNKIN